MPYELKPEPHENILLDVRFQPSKKSEPFHFAVTDQALYVPATKFVVSGDPHYFKRVKNDEIKSVSVQNIPPYGSWFVAALMLLAGVALAVMLLPALGTSASLRGFGWSLALIVGGILLPRVAKGRQRLVVVMAKGTFKWNPPLVVDKASKQQVSDIIQNILDSCRASGKPVVSPQHLTEADAATWPPPPKHLP